MTLKERFEHLKDNEWFLLFENLYKDVQISYIDEWNEFCFEYNTPEQAFNGGFDENDFMEFAFTKPILKMKIYQYVDQWEQENPSKRQIEEEKQDLAYQYEEFERSVI